MDMLIGFFSHTNDAVYDHQNNTDLSMLDDEALRVLNINMQKGEFISKSRKAQTAGV